MKGVAKNKSLFAKLSKIAVVFFIFLENQCYKWQRSVQEVYRFLFNWYYNNVSIRTQNHNSIRLARIFLFAAIRFSPSHPHPAHPPFVRKISNPDWMVGVPSGYELGGRGAKLSLGKVKGVGKGGWIRDWGSLTSLSSFSPSPKPVDLPFAPHTCKSGPWSKGE